MVSLFHPLFSRPAVLYWSPPPSRWTLMLPPQILISQSFMVTLLNPPLNVRPSLSFHLHPTPSPTAPTFPLLLVSFPFFLISWPFWPFHTPPPPFLPHLHLLSWMISFSQTDFHSHKSAHRLRAGLKCICMCVCVCVRDVLDHGIAPNYGCYWKIRCLTCV